MESDHAQPRSDESHGAVPPVDTRNGADDEKKAEKEAADAGAAREELNQAVRDQAAQTRSKESALVEPSTPPVATFSTPAPSPVTQAERAAPVTPSQIVVGGLSRAAAPSSPARKAGLLGGQLLQVEAKVTDVNGTIVSINVGSNNGFHTGDVVEIVRDNRVIATSKLSQAGTTFAVGPLQLAAGSSDSPRAGDRVRHASTAQPQR
jgi:hypothetical protein